MKQIENINIKEFTSILSNYIKSTSKKMVKTTNMVMDLDFANWMSGMGRDKKWFRTEVKFDGNSYIFTEKEITDEKFISILNDALAISGVRGRVVYDVCGDGYWLPKTYYFKSLEIFTKPCKEFISLVKYVDKNANFTIGDTDVFRVSICGKRDSHSDTGRYNYLCYNNTMCATILKTIRENKATRDIVKVSVEDYIDRGDEGDYRCAMYQESEWYGHRGNKLIVKIETPKGKKKLYREYYN
jgi:hypothetical protein